MRLRTSAAFRVLAASAAVGLAAEASPGAIIFNELMFDAPGANTNKRFFEVRSTTGGAESLGDLTLLAVDGDGGAAGAVDFAGPFGSVSTGSNGLALIRDSATVLSPPPAAATTVVTPDFGTYNENTTVTYLLVRDFTGTAGTSDIDADNDGTIDATPWSAVVDAVGFRDTATDKLYAAALGGTNYDESAEPFSGTDIGGFLRDPTGGAHVFRAAQESDTGPFTVAVSGTLPTGYQLTPGSENPAVPEPAGIAALGLGAVGLLGRRRRAAAC